MLDLDGKDHSELSTSPLHRPFCPMALLYTSISEGHKTNLTLKVRVVDHFGFLCWMQWFSLGKSPVILTLIKICSRKFQCLLHICCYQEGRGEKEKPSIDSYLLSLIFIIQNYPNLKVFSQRMHERNIKRLATFLLCFFRNCPFWHNLQQY